MSVHNSQNKSFYASLYSFLIFSLSLHFVAGAQDKELRPEKVFMSLRKRILLMIWRS